MEQTLRDKIRRFVLESPENRFPGGAEPLFDEPLIGFAAADDPLFATFKQVIGSFHLTPVEIMQRSCGDDRRIARTVICWILPIRKTTRESNRSCRITPSREWALTRAHGESFNNCLRRYVVDMLVGADAHAVAPLLSEAWHMVEDPVVGLASTWSERHAAYAAGLGTFSLSDSFITAKGSAHRCGSVVADLIIPPSPRNSSGPWSHCLYFRNGRCGQCIRRCPAGAISLQGHDKAKCRDYLRDTVVDRADRLYGVTESGCGLCQTGVPCEARIP